jgi:hypothetical protein
MHNSVLLISVLGIGGVWSASAAAESGCAPFGYCAAPTRQHNTYAQVGTDVVVGYRTVRVAAPRSSLLGYRAGSIAPTVVVRRPYRIYTRTVVETPAYSDEYAGPSVPSTR